jgi:hypothetical protein
MLDNQTAQYAERTTDVNLTTSYALVTLNGDPAGAQAPTKRVFAGLLVLKLKTLVTAASLTIKVTEDSTGDFAVTEEVTQTIVTGEGTATNGSVVATFNTALKTDGAAFYVWAKTDAGTITVDEAWLTFWEQA